ncbi:succinylglutamate-semialdehyde dehydrogenase [Altericroceibacterium spongiae]|uniref:Succinylglutamate-semialdehyde dehydrogenase n=2 Tax=Altericroceibacterium spongiae TaxID=2320269 RepID=A0A420ESE2_9SPHN|nr:succinylglutamate-semialdehyde dehydrogenase [Altericroceibacterium spongiae]
MQSTCPATGEIVWEGVEDDAASVNRRLSAARRAFEGWADTSPDRRVAILRAYAEKLRDHAEDVARTIARETGKPLWEARQEAGSMAGKVDISIRAQAERAGFRTDEQPFGQAVLRHQPHGVMAVLGPYNFPGHLPNGHIVPALLAGNAIVFKPSEQTPATGELIRSLLSEAGLPDNVLSVVQGGRETGAALIGGEIDGLLFTGSAATGMVLRRAMVERPHVIMALELGGNNPIIAWDGDPVAAASIIAQSAFITAGQRCSCARRLIVPEGPAGERIVEAVTALAARMRMERWDAEPEPTFGSLISAGAARYAREEVARLTGLGARTLLAEQRDDGLSEAFMAPVILDVTGIDVPDREIFAPVLQIQRVPDFAAAIKMANATAFGLSAGLVSEDAALWQHYLSRARAGVINWNRPTTGASGAMPFGGLGNSGNHRPSAYYAADYCAYPVASFEAGELADLSGQIKGLAPAAS